MALTEIYVDPSIAADSGAGTVGDPYGDLEYAIEQETFDTTNGTRINVRAGTDEVLAAQLETALADTSVSVAWSPSASAPLVIQGYTTTAGDGGVGGISGNGTVSIFGAGTIDYCYLVDLHLHNTGSSEVLNLDNWCAVLRCEINDSTGTGILCDNYCTIIGNYIHNVAVGVNPVTGGDISYNFITNLSGNAGINAAGSGNTVRRNIMSISGAANGVLFDSGTVVTHNSVYSAGGTAAGILGFGEGSTVANNLVEGFSGTGGRGIDITGATVSVRFYAGNSVYDCETAYDVDSAMQDIGTISGGGNETLTASPFTDAANGDFSPVDTGSVKEGNIPNIVGGGRV